MAEVLEPKAAEKDGRHAAELEELHKYLVEDLEKALGDHEKELKDHEKALGDHEKALGDHEKALEVLHNCLVVEPFEQAAEIHKHQFSKVVAQAMVLRNFHAKALVELAAAAAQVEVDHNYHDRGLVEPEASLILDEELAALEVAVDHPWAYHQVLQEAEHLGHRNQHLDYSQTA